MRNWNRLFTQLALTLIVISLIIGCRQSEKPISPQPVAEDPDPPPPKADPINIDQVVDQQWVLQTYGRIGSEKETIPETEITLQFMTDRVSGSGGCNRYFSSYQEEDGKLSMGPVASTRMFCAIPDGTMQQEQEYFKALQAVMEYDISANRQTLKLLYGDRKNNLLYTKKEELR